MLLEPDPDKARATAREHLHMYLNTPYNIAKFRRLGYTDEEIAHGGSDRLVDDLVFWGDLTQWSTSSAATSTPAPTTSPYK